MDEYIDFSEHSDDYVEDIGFDDDNSILGRLQYGFNANTFQTDEESDTISSPQNEVSMPISGSSLNKSSSIPPGESGEPSEMGIDFDDLFDIEMDSDGGTAPSHPTIAEGTDGSGGSIRMRDDTPSTSEPTNTSHADHDQDSEDIFHTLDFDSGDDDDDQQIDSSTPHEATPSSSGGSPGGRGSRGTPSVKASVKDKGRDSEPITTTNTQKSSTTGDETINDDPIDQQTKNIWLSALSLLQSQTNTNTNHPMTSSTLTPTTFTSVTLNDLHTFIASHCPKIPVSVQAQDTPQIQFETYSSIWSQNQTTPHQQQHQQQQMVTDEPTSILSGISPLANVYELLKAISECERILQPFLDSMILDSNEHTSEHGRKGQDATTTITCTFPDSMTPRSLTDSESSTVFFVCQFLCLWLGIPTDLLGNRHTLGMLHAQQLPDSIYQHNIMKQQDDGDYDDWDDDGVMGYQTKDSAAAAAAAAAASSSVFMALSQVTIRTIGDVLDEFPVLFLPLSYLIHPTVSSSLAEAPIGSTAASTTSTHTTPPSTTDPHQTAHQTAASPDEGLTMEQILCLPLYTICTRAILALCLGDISSSRPAMPPLLSMWDLPHPYDTQQRYLSQHHSHAGLIQNKTTTTLLEEPLRATAKDKGGPTSYYFQHLLTMTQQRDILHHYDHQGIITAQQLIHQTIENNHKRRMFRRKQKEQRKKLKLQQQKQRRKKPKYNVNTKPNQFYMNNKDTRAGGGHPTKRQRV